MTNKAFFISFLRILFWLFGTIGIIHLFRPSPTIHLNVHTQWCLYHLDGKDGWYELSEENEEDKLVFQTIEGATMMLQKLTFRDNWIIEKDYHPDNEEFLSNALGDATAVISENSAGQVDTLGTYYLKNNIWTSDYIESFRQDSTH